MRCCYLLHTKTHTQTHVPWFLQCIMIHTTYHDSYNVPWFLQCIMIPTTYHDSYSVSWFLQYATIPTTYNDSYNVPWFLYNTNTTIISRNQSSLITNQSFMTTQVVESNLINWQNHPTPPLYHPTWINPRSHSSSEHHGLVQHSFVWCFNL